MACRRFSPAVGCGRMPKLDTVTVPALCTFTYRGQSYIAGDPVTVPPIEAAALARQRCVTLDRAATYTTREITVTTPDPESEPERPRRRRYRRRDLQAEGE